MSWEVPNRGQFSKLIRAGNDADARDPNNLRLGEQPRFRLAISFKPKGVPYKPCF
jgi:hypothetical protein